MTEREALKLALEALDKHDYEMADHILWKALAQPEQEQSGFFSREAMIDQGPDYERGFIDGMQHQMQSSVDKAVNAMAKRTWVGLTNNEIALINADYPNPQGFARALEAKLKEKNGWNS